MRILLIMRLCPYRHKIYRSSLELLRGQVGPILLTPQIVILKEALYQSDTAYIYLAIIRLSSYWHVFVL